MDTFCSFFTEIYINLVGKLDMRCPECGNKIEENAPFCINCGSKIKNVASKNKTVLEKPEKRENNYIKIIGITTSVAILILVCFFAAFLVPSNMGKKNKKDDNASLVEAETDSTGNSDSSIFSVDEELDEAEEQHDIDMVDYDEEKITYDVEVTETEPAVKLAEAETERIGILTKKDIVLLNGLAITIEEISSHEAMISHSGDYCEDLDMVKDFVQNYPRRFIEGVRYNDFFSDKYNDTEKFEIGEKGEGYYIWTDIDNTIYDMVLDTAYDDLDIYRSIMGESENKSCSHICVYDGFKKELDEFASDTLHIKLDYENAIFYTSEEGMTYFAPADEIASCSSEAAGWIDKECKFRDISYNIDEDMYTYEAYIYWEGADYGEYLCTFRYFLRTTNNAHGYEIVGFRIIK